MTELEKRVVTYEVIAGFGSLLEFVQIGVFCVSSLASNKACLSCFRVPKCAKTFFCLIIQWNDRVPL